MGPVKAPAVAGMFYPADPGALGRQVSGFLHAAKAGRRAPKALIAPHAGYVYSGQAAAEAYASLTEVTERISRVVLLGPAHRVRLTGIATSSAHVFSTPLGEIPVDREAIGAARELSVVGEADVAFEQEHSLEVHLPFLQTVLADFQLAPFVVGQTQAADVAALLDLLWGGDETLIVVSSDLSHFHDYATAQAMDRRTSDNILQFNHQQIGYEDACGRNPVNGLLYTARARGMHAELAALCNSGDTAGSKDRVVGYGAYLFHAE